MKKPVKKLYMGRAEVRDYNVQECIDKNENFQIQFEDDVMTLTPEELTTKLKSKSQRFESKMDGKSYVLYGYNWEPDQVEL